MPDIPTPPIPGAFRVTCELCGLELDTRRQGSHQWTAGWVMQRRGGGGHGISMPVRENRWAHQGCVDSASRGFTSQISMFRGG
jgi:hypothetical protein